MPKGCTRSGEAAPLLSSRKSLPTSRRICSGKPSGKTSMSSSPGTAPTTTYPKRPCFGSGQGSTGSRSPPPPRSSTTVRDAGTCRTCSPPSVTACRCGKPDGAFAGTPSTTCYPLPSSRNSLPTTRARSPEPSKSPKPAASPSTNSTIAIPPKSSPRGWTPIAGFGN